MNVNDSLMNDSITGADVCSSTRDSRALCGATGEDCGVCGKSFFIINLKHRGEKSIGLTISLQRMKTGNFNYSK